MHTAAYPKIGEEKTSVNLAVKEMEGKPEDQYYLRFIRIAGLPATLKIIEDQIIEEENVIGQQAETFSLPGQRYGVHNNNT